MGPYDLRFSNFIDPQGDRFSVLYRFLGDQNLDPSVVTLGSGRHIILAPPRSEVGSERSRATTVLIAHYDRVSPSPGANDNGAAVFQLAEAALRLRKAGKRGWTIVFTDKEEVSKNTGIRGQGAYSLAVGFRSIGLEGGHFFIFDACGRGDTLIVSTTVDHLLRGERGLGAEKAQRTVQELRSRALRSARELSLEKILLMPTPFSDDAGFLAAQMAAQTITVLPADEAAPLARALRRQPRLARTLISAERTDRTIPSPAYPQTWKDLHSCEDTPERLTESSFKLMVNFACVLCGFERGEL
jgi:hypothetical protein